MKKTKLFLAVMFISSLTFAQDFSFDLIFTDAIGNKDTLVLGFDNNAGDSIDTLFGEKNIIDEPWNNVFEVRVGSSEFESKTQIKENNCENERIFCSSDLHIYCNNWPLTISWNNNLLNNNCSKYSVLTDCNPGGWFDTEYSFVSTMATEDTVVVEKFLVDYFVKGTDTIQKLYIDLGNEGKYGSMFGPFSSIEEYKSNIDIELFPIPTKDILTINQKDEIINSVHVYNLKGKVLFENRDSKFITTIDLSEVISGIYFVSIETMNGTFRQKIIKE